MLFYKRRGRSFLRSSSIEPGALAKKKVVPLSMGVERRESPFSTRQSHVTIIQTGYLYTTPSLPTYIGYYITRTVKRLKGKKWRKLFYLIFFVSLRIHNDDINFILTGVVDAACTDEKKKCDRLVYSSRSSTRPSTSSDLLIR